MTEDVLSADAEVVADSKFRDTFVGGPTSITGSQPDSVANGVDTSIFQV